MLLCFRCHMIALLAATAVAAASIAALFFACLHFDLRGEVLLWRAIPELCQQPQLQLRLLWQRWGLCHACPGLAGSPKAPMLPAHAVLIISTDYHTSAQPINMKNNGPARRCWGCQLAKQLHGYKAGDMPKLPSTKFPSFQPAWLIRYLTQIMVNPPVAPWEVRHNPTIHASGKLQHGRQIVEYSAMQSDSTD